MNLFLYDGVEFDLDCEFVDVTGAVWAWTGGWALKGDSAPEREPVLASSGSSPDLPLPDVYLDHGPLIPRRRKGTVTPGEAFAATVKAGYVEDVDAFGARIGGER